MPQNTQFPSRKTNAPGDLMGSGSGIPWEDRGSLGFFAAFFGTAFGIMFKPLATLAKMRRPETSTDASIYAYAIGVIWFLAALIQSAFAYFVFYVNDHTLEIDPQQYLINSLLGAALAGVAGALLPRLIAWMFFRLTSFDMTSNTPPVLIFNTIAYLMSPSLLALIPGGTKPWLDIAPCIAGLWMFILLLIAAIGRLRIRVGAAIIGSILTFLASAGMVIGGIFLIQVLWCTFLNKSSLNPIAPVPGIRSQMQ
jgi:hypothetical protein